MTLESCRSKDGATFAEGRIGVTQVGSVMVLVVRATAARFTMESCSWHGKDW